MRWPNGEIACEIKAEKAPIFDWAHKGHIISSNLGNGIGERWGSPIKAENYRITWNELSGKTLFEGEVKNRQKVGRWIEEGAEAWYIQGTAVSKHIYETPEDKLDVREILEIGNAQLRSAMLSKYTTQGMFDKLKAEGVDIKELEEGSMKLYTIPMPGDSNRDRVMKFLEVICPSTHAKYLLKVPPQAQTCEDARQWTFGVNLRRVSLDAEGAPEQWSIPNEERVVFAEET
jgi:hypothetical protein